MLRGCSGWSGLEGSRGFRSFGGNLGRRQLSCSGFRLYSNCHVAVWGKFSGFLQGFRVVLALRFLAREAETTSCGTFGISISTVLTVWS